MDEAIWEEIETGPRHQGRISANYLLLMALGGAIAATGLVAEPVPQTIAFVSVGIIARASSRSSRSRSGWPCGAGASPGGAPAPSRRRSAVLILAAALAFVALRLPGTVTVADCRPQPGDREDRAPDVRRGAGLRLRRDRGRRHGRRLSPQRDRRAPVLLGCAMMGDRGVQKTRDPGVIRCRRWSEYPRTGSSCNS